MTTYTYMLDPRLEYNLTRMRLNCTHADAAIIRNIHWRNKRRELENRWIDYELPKKGTRYGDVIDRIRLVYDCWRDHVESPRLTKRLHDADLETGHTLYLEVNVQGSPAPEVKWYKNGLPVLENCNAYVTHYRADAYILTIRDALPSDRGLYSCIASNIAGSVRTSAYVNVTKHRTDYPRTAAKRQSLDFYRKLYDLRREEFE